ncbi:fimbria/pilus periplasmic chaperone (plasmid) [Sphingomonas daechungensis]|uniref:Fimbria/pilus periplasmic chaperone n=2 Tax=Sphingomonas daechungensis TaxID=1176646 RepID=A0ABX6T3U6_9SPHN|nr:fimbria/pilus periplasmic chaperone [Sphingomonas daechungensis]QNP44556.1 fimbria/pilus periplasmic chaperone [Sphingomonas daechungensis]
MTKTFALSRFARHAVLAATLLSVTSAGRAELVLSQLIIDLAKTDETRADIEIWNNSDERSYILAEPSEIVGAGSSEERRVTEPDPEKRGLLVSPARMILEPGQRKLLRVAAIGARSDRERVYRVTVKPVTGELSAAESGLKLLVGYDVLVLVRPTAPLPRLAASRDGRQLVFRNDGNASLELVDGSQCTSPKTNCVPLPGKRLYAGARWAVPLKSDGAVSYTVVVNGKATKQSF